MDSLERHRAPGALYVKRPAEVVRQERATTEVLTAGPYGKHDLVIAVRRLHRRGLIAILGQPVWNESAGRWEVPIRHLKPAPPAWRRPALIAAAVLAFLGALIAMAWWALSSLATGAGISALALLGVGFIVWVLVRHRPDVRGGVDVDVRVRVR